jgi:hypothetical protein
MSKARDLSAFVSTPADAGSSVKLKEGSDNGSNFVELKAAASLAADTTFVLPSADGTNGQALTTNGSGVLAFSNVDSLPSQTGESGKYLTTDGTSASWGAVPTVLLVENRAGTEISVSLANGFLPVTNRAGSTINVSVS